jgi:hypothetical protein
MTGVRFAAFACARAGAAASRPQLVNTTDDIAPAVSLMNFLRLVIVPSLAGRHIIACNGQRFC